jgi:hypothetical protein
VGSLLGFDWGVGSTGRSLVADHPTCIAMCFEFANSRRALPVVSGRWADFTTVHADVMCYIGTTRRKCRDCTSSYVTEVQRSSGAVQFRYLTPRGLLQGCAGKDQPLRNPDARSSQPFPNHKFSSRTRLMNMIFRGPLLRVRKENRGS